MAFLENITTLERNNAVTTFFDQESSTFDDLSNETRKIVEKVWFLLFILPVCCVGIPANIINCFVFWCQGLQDRMNLCLFSLAIVDCLHLSIAFAIFPVSSFVRFFNEILGEKYYLKSMTTLVGVLYCSRATSGFIGVVIAVERCVCVVLPFRASTLISTKTMSILMIASFLSFQCVYVTYPLSLEVVWSNKTKGENWYMEMTQFLSDNPILIEKFQSLFLDVAIPVANLTILVVMTTITVVKLKVAMTWRQRCVASTRTNDSDQTALTVMLVVVSVVHIVTLIPYVVCQVIYYILPDPFNASYNFYLTFKAVSHSIPAMNSSIHIFIYYVRSSRYQLVFKNMFCHRLKHLD